MASVGAGETCGGVEPFRLLICFQSDLPLPSPPLRLFLLPPLFFFFNHLLSHSPRSLVSWAICCTRWAGLTLSSSCSPGRGKKSQTKFHFLFDFSRAPLCRLASPSRRFQRIKFPRSWGGGGVKTKMERWKCVLTLLFHLLESQTFAIQSFVRQLYDVMEKKCEISAVKFRK